MSQKVKHDEASKGRRWFHRLLEVLIAIGILATLIAAISH